MYFPVFSYFGGLGPFKNNHGIIFHVLDEKLIRKHVYHHPKPKFSVSPFLGLLIFDDIDLKCDHRKFRMVLMGVPDVIHAY